MSICEIARLVLVNLRVTRRLNTLDFVDCMDGIELADAVESQYNCQMTDDEAGEIISLGQLFDFIRERATTNMSPSWKQFLVFIRMNTLAEDGIDRETTFFAVNAKPRHRSP